MAGAAAGRAVSHPARACGAGHLFHTARPSHPAQSGPSLLRLPSTAALRQFLADQLARVPGQPCLHLHAGHRPGGLHRAGLRLLCRALHYRSGLAQRLPARCHRRRHGRGRRHVDRSLTGPCAAAHHHPRRRKPAERRHWPARAGVRHRSALLRPTPLRWRWPATAAVADRWRRRGWPAARLPRRPS